MLVKFILFILSSHGWASTVASIRTPNMKIICPTANTMPVSLNAGFRMPSWFDLKSLDIGGLEDEAGIRKATDNIHDMIRNEIQVSNASE